MWIRPTPGMSSFWLKFVTSESRSPPTVSDVKGWAFSSSRRWAATVAAPVAWLATLFELAATSIRFVTAMRPNTRITMATSASTSVKPASEDRFFMMVSVTAGC